MKPPCARNPREVYDESYALRGKRIDGSPGKRTGFSAGRILVTETGRE
jgi:hypothetical protein